MLDNICIPTLYDLSFVHYSLKASLSVNFEQFTLEGLSYNPGNVKLRESSGTAGGLPGINYRSEILGENLGVEILVH